jgi:hypothetical protein
VPLEALRGSGRIRCYVRGVGVWHVRGLVLPGSAERDLFIDDGRIQVEPVAGPSAIATDLFLLVPGLVEVHAHLALASPAGDGATPHERVRASARAHLDAGVLAVHERGSVDHASYGLGPDESLPRVITAGRFLAPPGRYFPGLAKGVTDLDLPEAALRELAHSGDWVKLIGDSPLPGPGLIRTFGEEAVVETVRRVHQACGRVAMHCGLPRGDPDRDRGRDRHTRARHLPATRPTAGDGRRRNRVGSDPVHRGSDPLDVDACAGTRIPEAIAAAADVGVPVLAGTDAGMGPHGMIRHEIGLLTGYGLSPEASIGAASWAARALLHLPGIAAEGRKLGRQASGRHLGRRGAAAVPGRVWRLDRAGLGHPAGGCGTRWAALSVGAAMRRQRRQFPGSSGARPPTEVIVDFRSIDRATWSRPTVAGGCCGAPAGSEPPLVTVGGPAQ